MNIEQLHALSARHVRFKAEPSVDTVDVCGTCGDRWPCDAFTLALELERVLTPIDEPRQTDLDRLLRQARSASEGTTRYLNDLGLALAHARETRQQDSSVFPHGKGDEQSATRPHPPARCGSAIDGAHNFQPYRVSLDPPKSDGFFCLKCGVRSQFNPAAAHQAIPAPPPAPDTGIFERVLKARAATTALRDFARQHGMGHRERDPLVSAIHASIDDAEGLAPVSSPAKEE